MGANIRHTLDAGGGAKRSKYFFFLKVVMLNIKLKEIERSAP